MHSSHIDIYAEIDGERWGVSHVGDGVLVLKYHKTIQFPTIAKIVVCINGERIPSVVEIYDREDGILKTRSVDHVR